MQDQFINWQAANLEYLDGLRRGFGRVAAKLLAEKDRLRREFARIEEILLVAKAFLAWINYPELRVTKRMWHDRKWKSHEALPKIAGKGSRNRTPV